MLTQKNNKYKTLTTKVFICSLTLILFFCLLLQPATNVKAANSPTVNEKKASNSDSITPNITPNIMIIILLIITYV